MIVSQRRQPGYFALRIGHGETTEFTQVQHYGNIKAGGKSPITMASQRTTGPWNGQRSNEPEIEEGLGKAESIQGKIMDLPHSLQHEFVI